MGQKNKIDKLLLVLAIKIKLINYYVLIKPSLLAMYLGDTSVTLILHWVFGQKIGIFFHKGK